MGRGGRVSARVLIDDEPDSNNSCLDDDSR